MYGYLFWYRMQKKYCMEVRKQGKTPKKIIRGRYFRNGYGSDEQIRRKKADIVLSETTITEHHRRPRSLGGTNLPSNISKISNEVHKAWTIITGNMNPEQICNFINLHFKPKGVTLVCKFIKGTRCTQTGDVYIASDAKLSYAWRVLHKDKRSFRNKIEFINDVLLDPSYRFEVYN